MPELRFGGFITEREQALLGPVEGERDVSRLVVGVGGDRGRRAEQPAKDRAVADDVGVPLDLDRGRDGIGERAQECRAADAIEFLAASQLDLDGERIDPLAPREERLPAAYTR